MRTLYIGETNPKDTKYYYELDKSARNLCIGNYETALEEKPTGVFYTGLPDFEERPDKLLQVCPQFDEFVYRPPAVWTKDYVKQQTEQFLNYIIFVKPDNSPPIKGYNKFCNKINDSIFANVCSERTDEPHMWMSGCSFSEAVGVTNEQRWATLLANKLNMPYTVLAKGGTGNTHQARKLLSVDIRENDVVIFQITTPNRETIFHPKLGQLHVNPGMYDIVSDLYKLYPPDRLDEITLVFNQIRDMRNVINFLQKTKARSMFWSPGVYLPMGAHLLEYFQHRENFYMYLNSVVDFGTDGLHPGPNTHKQYADFVFEKFKQQEEQV